MPRRLMLSRTQEVATSLAVGVAVSTISMHQHWWFVPGALFVMMLFFQMSEILSRYVATERPERKDFPWEKAIIWKALSLLIWSCILGLDLMRMLGVLTVERTRGHQIPMMGDDGFLWMTCTVTAMLIIAEMFRIANNVARYQGTDTDAWMLRAAVGLLNFRKVFDRIRWRESGHTGEPPGREADKWNEADIRRILSAMAAGEDPESVAARVATSPPPSPKEEPS